MEFLALCAPWLLGVLCLLFFFLLIFRKWKLAIVALFFVFLFNWYFQIIAIDLISRDVGDVCSVRVLSLNCNLSPKHNDLHPRRDNLHSLIIEQDPDIVFLTEDVFIRKVDSVWLTVKDNYPYRALKNNSVGNQIYSKYPVVLDTIFFEKKVPYCISYCQIDYKGNIVDVFGCHLSSNNFDEHMVYMTPDSIDDRHDMKNYFENVKKASRHREEEARLIVGIIDSIRCSKGERPTLVMGDFNDVCGSPTLKIFDEAGLQDAWWEGGLGYGATIHNPLPFRIDHILYNDRLLLRNIRRIDASHISDHDVLVAEFEVSKLAH